MKQKDFSDLTQKKLAIKIWSNLNKEKTISLTSRKREYVIYRHSFLTAMRKHSTMSLSEIGSILDKDHSTVLHACSKHDISYRFDRDYKTVYYQIDEIVATTMAPYSLMDEHMYDEYMDRNKDIRERLMKLAKRNRELITNNKNLKLENERVVIENEFVKKQSRIVSDDLYALKAKITSVAW
tara:strand:+ start:137 stop:682 length:546 start_codon:yes stop_codon:yes gene_type:complete